MLQFRDDAKRLRIVVEAAVVGHAGVERVLSRMAEGRVSEIVAEGDGLREIVVEPERPGESAGDLGHLDRMGESRSEMIALVIDEDLRLVGETPEGRRMDDPVPVALEFGAGRRSGLRDEPSAGLRRIGGVRGAGGHRLVPGFAFFAPFPILGSDECKRASRARGCPDMSEAVTEEGVSISESAARRLNKILKGEEGAALRISVKGGGCSGFQYSFDVERSREPDDFVAIRDGATVLVDPVSLDLIKGSELDFVDDLMGQAFRVKNPNAVASCGCGVSFTV